MSEFIDAVKAELTGRRNVVYKPLSVSIEPIHSIETPMMLQEYKIGVEWMVKASCDPKDIPPLIDGALRELREAIYGNIRDRINRLERAVYKQDNKAILSETRDIIKEIYG